MTHHPARTDAHLRLFTVGHSVLEAHELVGLLYDAQVDAIADVRSVPASRIAPQHAADRMRRWLDQAGIGYVFLGQSLGGRAPSPAFVREDRRVDYAALAARPAFTDGLRRLVDGAMRMRVALLCAEADPATCHRRRLVGRALAEPVGRTVLEQAGFGSAELVHLGAAGTWSEPVGHLRPAPDLFGARDWASAHVLPGSG